MKNTHVNLIPDTVNPTPDYYCTWQTQLYATSDGKPEGQRKAICEKALFDTEKPYGWAYFHKQVNKDLFLVMDDSWDVPLNNDRAYFGSLILSEDKFPSFAQKDGTGLKSLVEKIQSLGWKGLGGWVCAQESPLFIGEKSTEEYWVERLKAMHEAGMSYWKVDWGEKCASLEFRRMLTDMARIHAPNLTIEHAMIDEIIPFSDTFRTYDVPAIMSIPMTFEKLSYCKPTATAGNAGLVNCEDEAYIAAAGGYAMGIMRHPYWGDLPDGRADMSFPKVHRNLKTKMYEIIRAVRWHRIAPAFSGGSFLSSGTILSDTWRFEDTRAEMENWWFEMPNIKAYIENGVLTKSAPSAIARNTELPRISPDADQNIPYCITSLNPNGVYSVATLGRTNDRSYGIPRCDVTVSSKGARTIGIFGEYNTLTLETDIAYSTVLMQDLAGDTAYDVTARIQKEDGKIMIPGELISDIGTRSQPDNDTSEPGVVLVFRE